MANTKELIALVDLAYNTGSIGTNLANAIKAGNNGDPSWRVMAWYEIRYAYNAPYWMLNGKKVPQGTPNASIIRNNGLQNRRTYESNEFGLYSGIDGKPINDNEAMQVIRYLESKRTTIETYLATVKNDALIVKGDIKELNDALDPAKERLTENYAKDINLDGQILIGKGVGNVEEEFSDTKSGNDKLTGTTQNDLIFGEQGDDTLNGGAGNDKIFGGSGADTITGGTGNDYINGGYGNDTVVYSGKRAEYSVTQVGYEWVIKDKNIKNGDDGQDILLNVERLKFSNEVVNLTSGYSSQAKNISLPKTGYFYGSWVFVNGNIMKATSGYYKTYNLQGKELASASYDGLLKQTQNFHHEIYGKGYSDWALLENDGSFLVIGENFIGTSNNIALTMDHYDSQGNVIFQSKTIQPSVAYASENKFTSLSNGGVVVTYSRDYEFLQYPGNYDGMALIFNKNGEFSTIRLRPPCIDTATVDDLYAEDTITPLANGGFVFTSIHLACGVTDKNSYFNGDLIVNVFNSDGSLLKAQTLTSFGMDINKVKYITSLSNGGFAILLAKNNTYSIRIYDSAGNIQAHDIDTNMSTDNSASLFAASGGNFLFSSQKVNNLTTDNQFYDANGYKLHNSSFSSQYANPLGVGSDGTVFFYTGREDNLAYYNSEGLDSNSNSVVLMTGGLGNDAYAYSRGDGQKQIIDVDNTAGNVDILQFLDANQTNLWFQQSGNDLQMSVMGTSDQLTIKDWYSGASNQIERIKTAEGYTMYNTDIDKMVQAMAAFAPPTALQTNWTNGQMNNGQTLMTITHA